MRTLSKLTLLLAVIPWVFFLLNLITRGSRLDAFLGFIFLLAPLALILSVVGLFWKESRWLSIIGLVLTAPSSALFVFSLVV